MSRGPHSLLAGKPPKTVPVEPKSKVKEALNEGRILIMVMQVLLGFQYLAMFYPRFQRLPEHGQAAIFLALVLSLVAVGLLMAPTPFHRLVENGDNTSRIKQFAGMSIALALPLIAGSLALDLAAVTESAAGRTAALILALAVIAVAAMLWLALGMLARKEIDVNESFHEKATLQEKIETLLTEARVILPGAQALLGFQFSAMLTDKFETLPPTSQAIHTASLVAIALAVVLLIGPAAYHRVAANGEAREDVDRIGAWMVLGSLLPLALGLTGDLYVVAAMKLHAPAEAIAAAIAGFVLLLAFWAIYPAYARARKT